MAQTETRWCREKMPVATIPGCASTPMSTSWSAVTWIRGTSASPTMRPATRPCSSWPACCNLHRDELQARGQDRLVGRATPTAAMPARPGTATPSTTTCAATASATWTSTRRASRAPPSTTRSPAWRRTGTSPRMRSVTWQGCPPVRERPPRAGDYSFYGPGLPAMFMLMGNRPEDQRFDVGGSGMGWWWHTEYDTVEWADPDGAGAGHPDLRPCHPARDPERRVAVPSRCSSPRDA